MKKILSWIFGDGAIICILFVGIIIYSIMGEKGNFIFMSYAGLSGLILAIRAFRKDKLYPALKEASKLKKPTVAELQAILDGPPKTIQILANGELRVVEEPEQ